MPIPAARLNGGNEFWVERINFQPVAKGKRVVVAISGKNFSPQIGVLINGVPLVHSIGLAQPLIRDDSAAGRATADDLKDVEIPGHIERVDANKILLSFKMPLDFQGTPTITLIAPGRATDINFLPNVDVNDIHDTRLVDYPRKMFGQTGPPDAFRIDRVKVFRTRTSKTLTAQISGAGFGKSSAEMPEIFVNGSDANTTRKFVSPTVVTVEFPIPVDETIKITLVSTTDPKKETIESDAVVNPAFLTIANVVVITYEAATEDEPDATLVVKIAGTGFTDRLRATIEGKLVPLAVKSATEAILTVSNPKAAAVVTLVDKDTGQQVQTVITRKSKPPE